MDDDLLRRFLEMQDHSDIKKFQALWKMYMDSHGNDQTFRVSGSFEVLDERGQRLRVRPPRYGDVRRLIGDGSTSGALSRAMIERHGIAFNGRVIVELPTFTDTGPDAATRKEDDRKERPRKKT